MCNLFSWFFLVPLVTTGYFFRFSVDDVLHAVMDDCDDSVTEELHEVNVAFVPPVEDPNAVSDEDSDLSDDEAKGEVDHLPSRILRSQASCTVFENIEVETSTISGFGKAGAGISGTKYNSDALNDIGNTLEPAIKKIKPKDLQWKKATADQVITLQEESEIIPPGFDTESPVHTFQEFFSIRLVDLIVDQSNFYATQRNFGHQIERGEFLASMGVLIFSGL